MFNSPNVRFRQTQVFCNIVNPPEPCIGPAGGSARRRQTRHTGNKRKPCGHTRGGADHRAGSRRGADHGSEGHIFVRHSLMHATRRRECKLQEGKGARISAMHDGTSRSLAVSSRCLHDSVTAPPCPYLALPTQATLLCLIHLCQLSIPQS